ncbi:MAG: DUF4115 domain-containing protein [Chloroflexi bacterium]|nr:DUF4115 domain-containing protein [Chloroflexota bacterium]
MVQDYYAVVPAPQPTVKAASRILASGHERYHRTRLLWGLAVLVLLLACGYTIKQYNEIYAHPYSAPLLTPANLGAGPVAPAARHRAAPAWFRVQLRATAPVWVRVTADNRQVFQGILRPRAGVRGWLAHRALYVVTFEGARLRVTYNGRHLGQVANQAGTVVDLATPAGLTRVS